MPGLIGRKIGMTLRCSSARFRRQEGEEHHQSYDGYLQEGRYNTKGSLGRVQV